ncbi:MAG: DUF4954 family protein [Spirochaetales bacterium]|nr:DUF4954 family protein [Spirochaetales bacterium]
MDATGKTAVAGLVENSECARVLAPLKARTTGSRLFGSDVRRLSKKEIDALVALDNSCGDWSRIKVADKFKIDFIRGAAFAGDCVLGVFSGAPREAAPGVTLASGIYGVTIVNSEIGNDCLVKDCGLVAGYVVEEDAVLFRVDELSAAPGCAFGNGVKIPVGNETGGREVAMYAELDIALAARVALDRSDAEFQRSFEEAADSYRAAVTCDFGFAGKGAVVRNTRAVRNVYLGAGALIDGATLVENCTILSGPGERTEVSHGAVVRNSCLQWGCEATTMAIVVDSLLTEHSHVERHGKVTASIIGPNTGIAEGEVTSCLVGPFVGFHHQSLLIAALWPEGKGNVAYGANVGSNHTSRAPDQEIFCGEGVFFGLGTSVKFPSDFSCAPYSIVATGVDTLPQKIEFPFSLIASPARAWPDISPAFNEIFPGWVLSDNIYMVRRNEEKYGKRNKAKRTAFDFTVFRPEIVDLMAAARDRLRGVKETQPVYTGKDLAGLGKNYLTEEGRRAGIAAYEFYIEYYALSGLFDRLSGIGKTGAASLYSQKTDDVAWEHRRAFLAREGWNGRSVKENLLRLASVLDKIAEDTFRAKAKDDERGARIVPGYDAAAAKAEADGFIRSTHAQMSEAKRKINMLVADL